MDPRTQAKYEARAAIVKALAHLARMLIVEELSEHPRRRVCELTELIGTDVSTVSRHLAVLRNAGIVESQKHGTTVYYRLRVKCLRKFFECVESVLRGTARDRLKVIMWEPRLRAALFLGEVFVYCAKHTRLDETRKPGRRASFNRVGR